jgi:hypothetical protein
MRIRILRFTSMGIWILPLPFSPDVSPPTLLSDPLSLPPFHFDADPDPAFRFDAEADPDPASQK